MAAVLEDTQEIVLTRSQERALQDLLWAFENRKPGIVLEAPAGTGKTFLVGVFITQLLNEGYSVCATAPTNKAVGVLRGKIPAGCDTQTTHQLLSLRPQYRVDDWLKTSLSIRYSSRKDEEHYDVVIVDECSMVDITLLSHILNLWYKPFLVFVGDRVQLPPPASNEEESPVFGFPGFVHTNLSEIVRQKEGSPIIELATAIRQAKSKYPSFMIKDFANNGDLQIVRKNDSRELFDTRILAWTNETVERYNNGFHVLNTGSVDVPYCRGETIIFDRPYKVGFGEEAPIEYNNGDEMVISTVHLEPHPIYRDIWCWKLFLRGRTVPIYLPEKPEQAEHKIDRLWRRWQNMQRRKLGHANRMLTAREKAIASRIHARAVALYEAFASVKLGYASTVHKSQGSTLRSVLVDMADLNRNRSWREYNQLLYTAVTRPSERLLILV